MANYDPTRGDLGYVRLLISDTQNGPGRVFSDEEIGEVLRREGHPKAAAATLLLIIAGNEALIAKAIRTQDLQTDGPKVAAEMRAQAAVLRAEATVEIAAASASSDDIVVLPYSDGCQSPPELANPKWILSLG